MGQSIFGELLVSHKLFFFSKEAIAPNKVLGSKHLMSPGKSSTILPAKNGRINGVYWTLRANSSRA